MENDSDFNQSLIEKRQRSPTGYKAPAETVLDPIKCYNHVIESYNVQENRVNGTYLTQINGSCCCYSQFWKILRTPFLIIIFQLLIICPILGLWFYLWMLYNVIEYFRGLQVYNSNRDAVEDPFQNMIFCPEICRITNSINKFYEIQINDLQGFVFNPEVMKNLKLKESQGKIKFMVYNSVFWEYYENYPKLKQRHLITFLLGTLMLGTQVFLDIFLVKKIRGEF